jgi:hypothetical protein
VQYLESGKSKRSDVFWFVMELLQGDPMDTVLDSDGPIAELEAVKVVPPPLQFPAGRCLRRLVCGAVSHGPD